jgi:hypothetical protein
VVGTEATTRRCSPRASSASSIGSRSRRRQPQPVRRAGHAALVEQGVEGGQQVQVQRHEVTVAMTGSFRVRP